jgi:hypothetical protein
VQLSRSGECTLAGSPKEYLDLGCYIFNVPYGLPHSILALSCACCVRQPLVPSLTMYIPLLAGFQIRRSTFPGLAIGAITLREISVASSCPPACASMSMSQPVPSPARHYATVILVANTPRTSVASHPSNHGWPATTTPSSVPISHITSAWSLLLCIHIARHSGLTPGTISACHNYDIIILIL